MQKMKITNPKSQKKPKIISKIWKKVQKEFQKTPNFNPNEKLAKILSSYVVLYENIAKSIKKFEEIYEWKK